MGRAESTQAAAVLAQLYCVVSATKRTACGVKQLAGTVVAAHKRPPHLALGHRSEATG